MIFCLILFFMLSILIKIKWRRKFDMKIYHSCSNVSDWNLLSKCRMLMSFSFQSLKIVLKKRILWFVAQTNNLDDAFLWLRVLYTIMKNRCWLSTWKANNIVSFIAYRQKLEKISKIVDRCARTNSCKNKFDDKSSKSLILEMKNKFMKRRILLEIILWSIFTKSWWSIFCINCSKTWWCIFWAEFNFSWRRKCRSNENAENRRFEWLIYLISIN